MKTRKMKDSGVEWIGAIPDGWEVMPAKRIFSEVKDKNVDGRMTRQFSFRYGQIVDKEKSGRTDVTTDETITSYRIVKPNTIMINGLNLNYDFISQRVARVEEDGIITSAYLAVFPNIESISSEYALYLFKGYDSKQVFHGHGSGIRKTLNFSDFAVLPVVVPPLTEQRTIAAYLDDRCTKIDAMIGETKALIEEYKTWRQSLIFEAVTGKRPVSATATTKNAKDAKMRKGAMRDSGVEWIGAVPEGWGISSIKHHFQIVLGKMLCSEKIGQSDTLEKYFCAANVHFEGGADSSKLKEMWFSLEEKKVYKVERGDLLVVEGGAGAGGAAVVDELPFDAYVQNSILIVRGKSIIANKYAAYLLEVLVKSGYVDFVSNKATIPHFTKEKVGGVPLPLPPADELVKIVKCLDERCAKIDTMIGEKEALIADLERYKKSLIFECVTGKRVVA